MKIPMNNTDKKWFLQSNDLIGGWSLMNVDKPPSQCDYLDGEYEIADFITKEDAEHILRLHNHWLELSSYQGVEQ